MTPYAEQWSRIVALYKRGRISGAELKALGERHQKWFEDQRRDEATPFMTQDLKAYADHIEQFQFQGETA